MQDRRGIMTDIEYMKLAIEYAKKGRGSVNPNPMVGAVIVKNDQIIGEGYHQKRGEPHAERYALMNCRESAAGATLYVTLEPCCHYGKTPPCTQAIHESGITRIVVGVLDPNPLVAGKGVELLRKHGLKVVVGVLEEECKKLNEVFFHYISTKRPYVVMKYAMTMDGKIATYTGKSKWITGEKAREKVHEDRYRYSAIMVGVGTVLSDNPHLTCRLYEGRNPVRIICDTNLRTPLDSFVVTDAKVNRTIIATACEEKEKQVPYLKAGCEILKLRKDENGVDLYQLMEKLGEMEIDSIMLEGGSTLNWSALKSGIIQKIQVYIGAKIFGGVQAKSPIGGTGFEEVENMYQLKGISYTTLGEDLLIESEVIGNCSPE